MTRTRNALVVALAAAVAFTSSRPAAAAQYDTPQAVFEAALKKVRGKDYKGFFELTTEDTQTAMAGAMVLMTQLIKGFAGLAPPDKKEEIEKSLRLVDAALAKHGLTEDYLKKVEKPDFGRQRDPKKILAAYRKLTRPVKDKPQFLADAITAIELLNEAGGGFDTIFPDDVKLEDMKINGDTAKANVVGTKIGRTKKEPIEFKRVAGSWKIAIPLEELTKLGGGGPQPMPPGDLDQPAPAPRGDIEQPAPAPRP